MPPKRSKISLKKQLEEAERKGREEGRQQGMAELLAALEDADPGDLQSDIIRDECVEDGDYFYFRLNRAMLDALEQNQRELFTFLMKAGGDVNTIGEQGQTALHCAVKEGDTELVKTLLKAGARPNFTTFDLETPLSHAVKIGHIELVKMLLAAGADVHCGDESKQGRWLINYAREGDHVEMTQLLIEAGAYLGPDENNRCWTPLMLAAAYGKAQAAELFIKAGCSCNIDININYDTHHSAIPVLTVAAAGSTNGALDTIRMLLNSGAEVNYKDDTGYTALIEAALHGRLEAVRLLLSAGADVFSRTEKTSWTPEIFNKKTMNAYDAAASDAIKEIIKNEMHRRIAAALSVLPLVPVDVRQKIVQLYVKD